ncbi:MAG: hypothetical protein HN590_04945 [Calditrichaeota bacterium]|nr:hypothetical protein [Calditrichota bacterium]MBT7788484.1 hypothetical protein [Calditrichota bacterium]
MNKKHRVNNTPSIYLLGKVRSEDSVKDFDIYFSAYFGDSEFDSSLQISDGVQTEFYCPFCLKAVMKANECDICEAPMVSLQLEMGGMLQLCLEAFERNFKKTPSDIACSGMLQFCSRRACERHNLEFENQDTQLKEFYDSYSQYLRDPEA